jgi:LacI family transcriptional regulator
MGVPSKAGVREIARLAGVSLGTVDRALHGRREVSEETRRRVLAVAAELGYQPNLTARALSAARKTFRVGVCIPREIRFFYDQVRDGILDEARRFEHLGLEVLYEPIPRLGVGEAPALRRMMKQNVRAIVATPGHPGKLAPLIDEAETRRDIRVVCICSDDSVSTRSTAISVDPELNGRLAAELMAKLTPPGAAVAVFTGMLATEDHGRKVHGFSQAFPRESGGGCVLPVIEDHQVERETYQKCAHLLKSQPGLAGIYISTANCLPVCQAIHDSGLGGRIQVIATDLFTDAVPWLESGVIAACLYQHPYTQGQTAIRVLVDHFVQGAALPKVHYLNPAIVLRTNVRLFREAEVHA